MLIITLILVLLMLIVFYMDASRFIIPNWLVGCVLALYPMYLYASATPIDWQGGLIVGGLAFLLGIILFATRIMGGGDVKLLAVCCLWVGMDAILEYIIYVSLLGGGLALFLLLGRSVFGYVWLRVFEGTVLPGIFEKDAPVPYGLAIAGAMLILIYQEKLIGLRLPL